MSEIEKIDKNLMVRAADENGFVWYDCMDAPFRVYGLIYEGDGFVRMPQDVASNVNDGVALLNDNTAGGRVRFATDSPDVSIRVQMRNVGKMPHFPLTGSVGFDLYCGHIYTGTFTPPFDIVDRYTSTVCRESTAMSDMVLDFPLYSGVKKLEIGLREGAALRAGREYRVKTPVVYYGSSITQGGCASRPGNSYQSVVSRLLDCDFVNLGFSGSARGEDAIAEYIAGLNMSAFVYDYDHNAPSPEHLERTHAKMFRTIRERNPELPVVMMTRPDPRFSDNAEKCRAIIMKTYTDALAAGDKNVYFLDGRSFVRDGDGTVDGSHPNDLGFRYMAEAVGGLLKGLL